MIRWLLIFLLIPIPSWAAITFDADSGGGFGGVPSGSANHTVAADANIAIVCVGTRENGGLAVAPTVTIGGQAMTHLDGVTNSSGVSRADLFYKLSPLTGVQSVEVTGGAGADRVAFATTTWKGVAQTGTFNTVAKIGSSAAGTNADLDAIPSAVGELVVLCGAARVQTATPSPDATAPVSTERREQPFDLSGTSTMAWAYSEDGAASTVDMRIDLGASEIWAQVAASMREVASSATFGHLRRRY